MTRKSPIGKLTICLSCLYPNIYFGISACFCWRSNTCSVRRRRGLKTFQRYADKTTKATWTERQIRIIIEQQINWAKQQCCSSGQWDRRLTKGFDNRASGISSFFLLWVRSFDPCWQLLKRIGETANVQSCFNAPWQPHVALFRQQQLVFILSQDYTMLSPCLRALWWEKFAMCRRPTVRLWVENLDIWCFWSYSICSSTWKSH